MSLRFRLAVAGALAIMLALGLTALGLSQLFGAHVERRAVAEMGVQLDQVLAGIEPGPDGPEVARPPTDPRFGQPYSGYYWQVAGAWGVDRSRSLWDEELSLPPDGFGTSGVHVHRLSGPGGTTLLVLERSVTLPSRLGGGQARAAVTMDSRELDIARRAFMTDLAPYLLFLAMTLTFAGWVQLWVGLRPLRGLGARVAALRAGETQRMGADWPREVRPVATEIDALLEAREVEMERARSRAADLAHGLKTPLQALMGEAARLRDTGAMRQAAAIEDTANSMRRTVDRELARARTAARDSDTCADAARAAERLIAVLRRTPDGGRLTWDQGIASGVFVALHESDLAEALGALAENASRHARSKVILSATRKGAQVSIAVADDGPGIPATERDALMLRHVRADERGTGLGLSIAHEIALAAGGRLELSDAAPGLVSTLVLPEAKPSAKAR